MADLSDLEMTKLCAEAMGYENRSDTHARGPSNSSILAFDGGHFVYDPCHNRAQAIELVEKLRLNLNATTVPGGNWIVTTSGSLSARFEQVSRDLLRAICLCVARMQQAKKGAKT